MAEARAKDEWVRVSAVMALLANCHRDPKKTRPFKPADFDPFTKRAAPLPVDLASLKAVFLEGRFPRSVDSRMPGYGCPGQKVRPE